LACAAEAGVDLFLTNDRRLKGRSIPGIQFLAGLDNPYRSPHWFSSGALRNGRARCHARSTCG
jgi:hypothetical protein